MSYNSGQIRWMMASDFTFEFVLKFVLSSLPNEFGLKMNQSEGYWMPHSLLKVGQRAANKSGQTAIYVISK